MPDRISFTSQLNNSIQVGDMLLFVPVNDEDFVQIGGMNPTEIGTIEEIGQWTFTDATTGESVDYFFIDVPTGTLTASGASTSNTIAGQTPLFLFRKNNQSNISTLVGYFGRVRMTNTDTERNELYAIGSEIFVSSK